MLEQKATIVNPSGIHARCAMELVTFINQFQCEVQFIAKEKTINAKSILNVLGLGLQQNSHILIRTKGPDEAAVLQRIIDYISALQD